MALTDDQATAQKQRPKPPLRLGLSGKLLLLTIPLVMIAGLLIYVPAIANFRMNRPPTPRRWCSMPPPPAWCRIRWRGRS